MSVHLNSLLAYYDEIKNFNQKEKYIYGHLAMQREPQTDREIKDELYGKMADQNTVRPRITDLKKKGWIIEVDKVKDYVTGKSVRRVRAVSAEEKFRLANKEAVQQPLL